MNNQNSLIRKAVYNDPQEMHGGSSQGGGSAGYVPAPPSDGYNTKYLRADGTWQVPPDTDTWNALVGATASADGTAGYAPTPPSTGYDTKFLRADGTWAVPSGGGGSSYTPTIDIDGTTYEIEHYVSNGVPYTKLTEVSS